VPPELISLRQVGKTFANGTVALAGVDLAVREGELLALLGPSGCGKSTALRLIAGLGSPTAGDVERRLGAERGQVGFVFQDPTLMPWATVEANVAAPLRLLGVAPRQRGERTAEALSWVGLSEFAAAYPRELSGGMRMRASLARSLVTRPRLLLLDEPFAALDEITRGRLNDDLLRLWQRQRLTAVFVTHSVFESVYLSSRIAVMSARPGRIASEVEVPEPYPRGAEYRLSARYQESCRAVSDLLLRAMGDGP
jgi:NitT/TauT family transport system ATP-binding protein